jgi:hypothetical protein
VFHKNFLTFSGFLKKAVKSIDQKLPIFNPNSYFKVIWDSILLTFSFFWLYFYSIEKGFVTQLNLQTPGYLLIVMLYIDILMKLNTKIFTDGLQIIDRRLILRNFFRQNLISDVLPCLVLSIIYLSKNQGVIYDLNLILLAKLKSVSELSLRIRELIITNDKAESIFNLLILLLKIFILGHVIACLWHYIGYISNLRDPESDNWLKNENIVHEEWIVKYLFSIYWGVTTMLTVGYGDITPTNQMEMLFNIWAMFIGCGMFGYSMNRIGEILKYAGRKEELLK